MTPDEVLAMLQRDAHDWQLARAWATRRRLDVQHDVEIGSRAGISEYVLAEAAGVTRKTIRTWLGKNTHP